MIVNNSTKRDHNRLIIHEEIIINTDERIPVCIIKNGTFRFSISSFFLDEREIIQAVELASKIGSI